MYRNAPLAAQITNLYRNRAIGVFLQQHGVYVIPQVRWGNELTYITRVFHERIAFLGVEQESIVAIGTYGCIDGFENKYHFEAGLDAMLQTLLPKIVLVYGAMPEKRQRIMNAPFCRVKVIEKVGSLRFWSSREGLWIPPNWATNSFLMARLWLFHRWDFFLP